MDCFAEIKVQRLTSSVVGSSSIQEDLCIPLLSVALNTPAGFCSSATWMRQQTNPEQSFGGRETWAQIPTQPLFGLTPGKWNPF